MPFRYEQFCPLARAVEILGERWTLLIARELACGPQRFSDLRRRLPGLSSSVLSQRLAALEERDLVARVDQPPPAPAALYRLTAEGERLRPVLRELMRFGVRYVTPPMEGDHLEPEWVGLAMEAFARTTPVARRVFAIHLSDGEQEAVYRVRGGRAGTRVEAREGPADLVVHAAPLVLLGVLTGQLDPKAAAGSGALRLDGDEAALADLPGLFDLEEVMAQAADG